MAKKEKPVVPAARQLRPWEQIVETTVNLTTLLGEAGKEDLEQANKVLQRFRDAWLVSGDGADLPGTNRRSCLADVDVTERIQEAIEIKLEYYDDN